MRLGLAVPALTVLLSGCAAEPVVPPPSGAQTFATHCAACHGMHGEGDGPVAAAMRGAVPNLRTLSQRNGGEFPADTVAGYIDGRRLPAAHGDRYMPVWGLVFDTTPQWVRGAEGAEPRIEAVVAFLRDLQYP